MEAASGVEPEMAALQTAAFPLGYAALISKIIAYLKHIKLTCKLKSILELVFTIVNGGKYLF